MTFWRRIVAGLYDLLILISWLMLATFFAVIFNSGQAYPPYHIGYVIYLLTMSFLLFGWCWTHGGQTLGMLAWKIKVLRQDGQKLTWQNAALRFTLLTLNWLCLGTGWLWCLFDRDRQSLHDRLSKTMLCSTRLTKN